MTGSAETMIEALSFSFVVVEINGLGNVSRDMIWLQLYIPVAVLGIDIS